MNPFWFNLALLAAIATHLGNGQDFSHGTAIALIKTPDKIVAAVESGVSDSRGKLRDTTVCKIGCANDLYYVAADFSACPPVQYDVFQILRNICGGQGGFKERFDHFMDTVGRPLNMALVFTKIHDPIGYERMISHRDALTASFFGLEADSIFLANVTIAVDTTTNNPGFTRTTIYVFPGGSHTSFFVGDTVLKNRFLVAHKSRIFSDPENIALDYVRYMITNDSTKYRPPINMVVVDRYKGVQWKEPKDPSCQTCQ